MKKNLIILPASILSICFSLNSVASDDPIIIKSPSIETIAEKEMTGFELLDGINIDKDEFTISYNVERVKRKRDGYTFSISYDLSLLDSGEYHIKSGKIKDDFGFSEFNLKIDKEKITGKEDFVDMFQKSRYVEFSSYSNKISDIFLKNIDIVDIISKDKNVIELLDFKKNNDFLNIKKALFSIGNDVSFQFNGSVDLKSRKVIEGELSYRLSNSVFEKLKKSGLDLKGKEGNLKLKDEGYYDFLNKII